MWVPGKSFYFKIHVQVQKETGRYLKQLTGFNVLFARRKQLKILSVLLTENGTTLACAGYLIFEQDLTSFL